jgi:hypothetical protein
MKKINYAFLGMGILCIFMLVFTVSAATKLPSTKYLTAANSSKVNNSVIEISEEEPNKVEIGIYVLSLGKFDISTGSFTVDFYLSMKCSKNCSLQDFEFMNGRASSIEKVIDKGNERFYRIQANLNSPVNLKKFPFDEQQMQIILEDKRDTIEELIYLPLEEETGVDSSIVFTGWNIKDLNVSIKEHYYPVYNETYSQYVLTIPIIRILVSSIIKTFLPIAFIILVMLSSFVLDPDKITTRLAMVGSALVASVMFHVSLANQIPAVGYLTFADKFMVLSYFVILLSFVFNVILLELNERKKEEIVKKFHSYTEFTMFILVPLLYILLFIFFI